MKNTNLALVEQPATRINNLHKELRDHGLSMVEIAIQAGGLLVEQKARVGHGHWLGWIEDNLIFGAREAQNYIRCYQNRDQLNTQCVSHLGEAVSLLASPKKEPSTEGTTILVQGDQEKSEGSTSEEQGTSRKSQGTVAFLAPKACSTPKLAEWHTVRQSSGWYSGLASNKVRDRCRELQSQFVSLHLEMVKFFRNDANARKEKLSRDDWNRLHEETNCFALWLYSASQGMGKAAGVIKLEKGDITIGKSMDTIQ